MVVRITGGNHLERNPSAAFNQGLSQTPTTMESARTAGCRPCSNQNGSTSSCPSRFRGPFDAHSTQTGSSKSTSQSPVGTVPTFLGVCGDTCGFFQRGEAHTDRGARRGAAQGRLERFCHKNGSRNAPRKSNTCDRRLLRRSVRRSSSHQLPRGQLLVCMTPLRQFLRSWKGGCSGNTASLREALESGDTSTVVGTVVRSVREGEATHVVLLVTFQGSWTTPAHSASVTHVTSEGGSPIASHVSSDAPQPTARRTRSPRGVNMSDWDECRGQSRRTASPRRANSSPHRSANKKLFRRGWSPCLQVRISPRPQVPTPKVSNFDFGDDVSSEV